MPARQVLWRTEQFTCVFIAFCVTGYGQSWTRALLWPTFVLKFSTTVDYDYEYASSITILSWNGLLLQNDRSFKILPIDIACIGDAGKETIPTFLCSYVLTLFQDSNWRDWLQDDWSNEECKK
jgi:hypothetical protein